MLETPVLHVSLRCRRMAGKNRKVSRRSELSSKGSPWMVAAPQGWWNIKQSITDPKGFFTRWFSSSKYSSGWRRLPKPPHSLWPAHNCQSREATPPRRPQGTSVYLSSCLSIDEAKILEDACLQTYPQIPAEEKNVLGFHLVPLLAWFKAYASARG